MKKLIVIVVLGAATVTAGAAHSLVQAQSTPTVQPYHQESSVRAVRSGHTYRIVSGTGTAQHN